MYIDQLRRLRQGGQAAVPRWALVAVRCCVIGMLVLPVVTSLVMAGHLGDASLRSPLLWGAGGLWAAAFACAMALCCRSLASNRR